MLFFEGIKQFILENENIEILCKISDNSNFADNTPYEFTNALEIPDKSFSNTLFNLVSFDISLNIQYKYLYLSKYYDCLVKFFDSHVVTSQVLNIAFRTPNYATMVQVMTSSFH